jgi:hypothetical protein
MIKRLKAWLAYKQVKKSETEWVRKVMPNSVFYYKGGLSGRFMGIEEEGIVKYGTYDGACPSIEDATFTIQGLVAHQTTESAMIEIEKIIKESTDVHHTT